MNCRLSVNFIYRTNTKANTQHGRLINKYDESYPFVQSSISGKVEGIREKNEDCKKRKTDDLNEIC